MKWFKHETNANTDAKLRKLRIKYGMEGYGVYWYCLELIGQGVEPHNLNFELEHDSEIIAHDTGIHYERVQEMMTYMINLGLFESNGVIVTCLKMAIRSDEYTQKALRNIKNSGQSPDKLRTNSGQTPDKVPSNRKNKKNKKKEEGAKPSLEEIKQYFNEKEFVIDPIYFHEFFTASDWIDTNGNEVVSWKQKAITWNKNEKARNVDSQFKKNEPYVPGAI